MQESRKSQTSILQKGRNYYALLFLSLFSSDTFFISDCLFLSNIFFLSHCLSLYLYLFHLSLCISFPASPSLPSSSSSVYSGLIPDHYSIAFISLACMWFITALALQPCVSQLLNSQFAGNKLLCICSQLFQFIFRKQTMKVMRYWSGCDQNILNPLIVLCVRRGE